MSTPTTYFIERKAGEARKPMSAEFSRLTGDIQYDWVIMWRPNGWARTTHSFHSSAPGLQWGAMLWAQLAFFMFLVHVVLRPIMAAFLFTRPPRLRVAFRTPADWGADYRDVVFPGAGGITLAGWHLSLIHISEPTRPY